MKGIGASPGIAIGKAFLLKKQNVVSSNLVLHSQEEVDAEIQKFHHAVKVAVDEVEALKVLLVEQQENDSADILDVQLELLQDEQISADVIEKILSEHKTANDAVIDTIDVAAEMFRNMQDEYFSARAADIQDAGNRILKHLNGQSFAAQQFPENAIIIAHDLTPSDTIALDITKVVGFATRAGGKTSHAAIVAKSKGLPAVVGCGNVLASVQNGDTIILDGTTGEILVNPPDIELAAFDIKRAAFAEHAALLRSLKKIAAVTKDGARIQLMANISNAADMDESIEYGSEGSGLMRTELLFMQKDALPGEEEQFEFYKSIAVKAKGHPVTVRTLDIGGDKSLPYFNLPQEQNPFLGYRAIRICLDRKDIFVTQLRAILRASMFGKLKIMFPMISNIGELRQAKAILNEVKNELLSVNIPFDREIETGIMIEIPSAAITADILAKEADFFSIGTNDLCQYTLAVDRMNEQVKHLYDPFNPGVLRLISNVIEQGKKHNIEVSMCGELAGDPLATVLLVGMGLTTFSMSASSIPYIKNIIINTTHSKAAEICGRVMNMHDSQNIIQYLQEVNP